MSKHIEIHTLPAAELDQHSLSADCLCDPKMLASGEKAVAYSHQRLNPETKDHYVIKINETGH